MDRFLSQFFEMMEYCDPDDKTNIFVLILFFPLFEIALAVEENINSVNRKGKQ